MIKNYLKTAWRNLSRHPVYSSINIVGLTIGLCACLLVASVVLDDLSYDRQWSRSSDLYRIISINKMGEGLYNRSISSFAGLANSLRTNFPEVAAITHLYTYQERLKLNDHDPAGILTDAMEADTSLWKMLDLKVIAGDPRHYISGSQNLVITESFKRRFFPTVNPVGMTVYNLPTYGDRSSFVITGIIKDLPANTVFRSDVIVLSEGSREVLSKQQSGSLVQQFILLKPHTNAVSLTSKLNKWYAAYVEGPNPYQFELQPLKDVYLRSDFAEEQPIKGSYQNVYIFSGVAALLLLIACVNFINLSTARAVVRIQETGVRKVLGAGRVDLMLQFLTESLLFFAIATVAATVFYLLTLGMVEEFVGHHLQTSLASRTHLLSIAYGSMLLISVLTGLYPAWVLSSYKPSATLKGKLVAGKTSAQNIVRKGLVVIQFAIAVIILIGLVVVDQQLRFIRNKDLGYDKDNLLYISAVSWDGKGAIFKNELLRQPGVVHVSISGWGPKMGSGNMSREIDQPGGGGAKITVWHIFADLDFAATLGMRLQRGRLFSNSFADDAMNTDSLDRLTAEENTSAANRQSSLITAYTARLLQVKSLNEPLKDVRTTPVGILADFNTNSLKEPLVPTVIVVDPSPQVGGVLVRVVPGSQKSVLASIHRLWQQTFPEKFLEVQPVDELLASQYEDERKLQQLFTFFGNVSLLLAALGLFGLAVQATHQRVKEIGIRKVLGASVESIIKLFTVDFIRLVIIAILIASPIAYWLMKSWLMDFAYRIDIQWWMFAAAGGFVVLIAVMTVSLKSIQAALANPAKSLRTE